MEAFGCEGRKLIGNRMDRLDDSSSLKGTCCSCRAFPDRGSKDSCSLDILSCAACPSKKDCFQAVNWIDLDCALSFACKQRVGPQSYF